MVMAEARELILADLRDRRLLKWLFRADADTNHVPIGYVEDAIDLETQHEMVDRWVAIARASALEEAASLIETIERPLPPRSELAAAIRALATERTEG